MSVRTHRLLAILAASAAATALAGPVLAATALDGAVNVVANASVSGAPATDQHSDSWTAGAFTTLSAAASATATSGALSVATTGSVTANWASANAGDISFSDYGWDFNATGANGSSADLTQGRGGSDWSYTFVADGNGQIVMDYSVLGSGSEFGLQGWQIAFSGAGAGGPTFNTSSPTTSGQFIGTLLAGQQYTITLDGNPNISAGGGGVFAGHMNGDFSWKITDPASGTPEPAAWALMIAGFGLAGVSLRRRRAAIAA